MKYLILVLLIVLISFIGFGLLILFNSGNPKPYTDTNGKVIKGSISEKIFLNINGCKQGLIIKGKNIDNPVLLYLHGGMPDYFLTQNYPTGLENLFTVVWWEQRGTGISYDKNMSKDKLTTRQLIEDTNELSKYLIKRFGKQKIYLMGHSGGTFIGIQTAAESPELFHAYMAVAQITNQFQSEKLACNYMLKQYEQNGDKQMMKKLKAAEITGDTLPESYLKIRDEAMHMLGVGTTRKMNSIVTGLFFPSILFKEYTMTEKWRLWQAKAHSGISVVWSDMIKTDIPTKVHELKIPIWFFHGEHDYTVSYPLAKAYFEKIKAPEKQFFSFKESAHSPMFEEPINVELIIKNEILNIDLKHQ